MADGQKLLKSVKLEPGAYEDAVSKMEKDLQAWLNVSARVVAPPYEYQADTTPI